MSRNLPLMKHKRRLVFRNGTAKKRVREWNSWRKDSSGVPDLSEANPYFEPSRTLRARQRYSVFPKTLKSRVNGSKNLSTTRSLRGIIALSVIVMLSGHTFVQHLVMLQ